MMKHTLIYSIILIAVASAFGQSLTDTIIHYDPLKYEGETHFAAMRDTNGAIHLAEIDRIQQAP
ncbi:MAG TPA: hypothetical protein VFA55_01960, partial [Candidatus Kapabacteria bacterium]|nr:hypothetical protein [Candidatus Kapabacteria bacterium]